MDKRASIVLSIPSGKRIAPDVLLSDLALKLRGAELLGGHHEIVILSDGSIELNGMLFWQPRPSTVEPPRKKAG